MIWEDDRDKVGLESVPGSGCHQRLWGFGVGVSARACRDQFHLMTTAGFSVNDGP